MANDCWLNGTFVDEKRVPPNEKMPLPDGSVIKVGPTTELRFELADSGTQVIYSKP